MTKKKISKPKIAIIDCDYLIVSAASSTFHPWYIYKDQSGQEIQRFDSAEKGKTWVKDMEEMLDIDPSEYVREVEYEVGDPEDAKKTFDNMLKRWVKMTGCANYQGYCAKASGLKTFRSKLATIKEYKKSRDSQPKPPHLEIVREHALKNPNIKPVKKSLECDDYVVAIAEKKGQNACLCCEDKDGSQIVNSWFLQPSARETPVFHDASLVGTLGIKDNGKVFGSGYLFLLWQCLASDPVDNIGGCKGIGDKGAYKMLKDFSGEPVERLEDVVKVVAEKYKKVYGDKYKYNHWNTQEEITASWKDIMIENLLLLWMKRNDKDKCEVITQYLEDL